MGHLDQLARPGKQTLHSTYFLNGTARPQTGVRHRIRSGLILLILLLLVALVGLLDRWTGPYLNFNIFYLIPVVSAAWYLNLPSAMLLTVIEAVVSHIVESDENPLMPPGMAMFNGITRFCTMTLIASLVVRVRTGILRERRLARTDALTGAANARTFYEVAESEAKRGRRGHRPLTIAYFDLDNFKQLNDRLGHTVGDEALVAFVTVIAADLRDSDLLARLGGDEFALLLPDTDTEGGAAILARLQGLVLREMKQKNWPLTVSIGAVSFLLPAPGVDRMIQHVDALMYAAKRQGKGRIVHVTVEDGAALPSEADRRGTARVVCNRVARVRREGEDGVEDEVATVHDISPGGVGLHLEKALPPETVLVIEPLSPEARTLLVRVVWSKCRDGKWEHGCIISNRLTEEEMDAWLGKEIATQATQVGGAPLPENNLQPSN
jgi:diguanylate cyclase (GGDEF)-like protein